MYNRNKDQKKFYLNLIKIKIKLNEKVNKNTNSH